MTNALSWFDIPVSDIERAAKFYGEILGAALERYSGPGVQGALFPVPGGGGGTLIQGEGFTSSYQGSIVYLSGGDDLNAVLNFTSSFRNPSRLGIDRKLEVNRVAAAGGKVLLAKTDIGENGFFAYFEDTEGNRVGLHSRG